MLLVRDGEDGRRRRLELLLETAAVRHDEVARVRPPRVLHALVDQGNTVLVIEHNLDVVKTADWIIDIGPEGGDGGGKIVATGTPETLIESVESYTGQYLKSLLVQDKVAAE